jgi:hypothetical protein
VPLLIKQPHREGAGRRVTVPVQHIDLLPTILDLVRAPIPDSLTGRSLRGLLTDEHGHIDSRAIYSESRAAYFRFGGHPLFGLTVNGSRYVRGMTEQIEPIDAADTPSDALAQLRATLDRLLAGHAFVRPESIPEADRERLALSAGYLPGLRPVPGVADVRLDEAESQQPLTATHQRAARLAGQRRLPAAIHVLQRMRASSPRLRRSTIRSGRCRRRSAAHTTRLPLSKPRPLFDPTPQRCLKRSRPCSRPTAVRARRSTRLNSA